MKTLFKVLLVIPFIILGSCSFSQDELLEKGDYRQAYINFDKKLKEEQSPVNYLNMCRVTYYLNQDKTAKAYCNKALNILDKEKHPDLELKSNILSMLGNIYSLAYRNTNIAFEYYSMAKELKEKNPDTDKYELAKLYLNMGYAYHNIGEYFLTRNSFDKAIEIADKNENPKYKVISAAIYNDLGVIERQNQNYLSSKDYFEKGLKELEAAGEYKNNKLEGILNYNLGYYYEHNAPKKDNTKADRYYTMANSCYDTDVVLNISEHWINNSELNSYKKEDIETILKEFPYDAQGLYLMAKANLMLDDDNAAQENIETLINTYKESAIPYALAADAYSSVYAKQQIKNPVYSQTGKRYLDLFMKKYINNPVKYYTAGCILLDLNKINKADKYFEQYVKLPPYTNLKYLKIADLYNGYNITKYKKKAAKYYERAIQNGNNDMYTIMDLWMVYHRIGAKEKADALDSIYNCSSFVEEYNKNQKDESKRFIQDKKQ